MEDFTLPRKVLTLLSSMHMRELEHLQPRNSMDPRVLRLQLLEMRECLELICENMPMGDR